MIVITQTGVMRGINNSIITINLEKGSKCVITDDDVLVIENENKLLKEVIVKEDVDNG